MTRFKSLLRRIEAVEEEIKKRDKGLFTVFYRNGSVRKIPPADAILLCRREAGEIKRFEETTGESDNGLLEGLVNALLLPDDTKKEGADNDKKTPYR